MQIEIKLKFMKYVSRTLTHDALYSASLWMLVVIEECSTIRCPKSSSSSRGSIMISTTASKNKATYISMLAS